MRDEGLECETKEQIKAKATFYPGKKIKAEQRARLWKKGLAEALQR